MATSLAYRRIAGTAAVLVVIATSLLGAGLVAASGAGYAEDGQRVEFTGGSDPARHLCRSRPSRASLTVLSGARITFGNQLGQPAMLRIDGRDSVVVGPDEEVPVVFNQGRVSVSMVLLCGSGSAGRFEAVTVVVVPAPGGSADPATQNGPAPVASVHPSRPVVAVESVMARSGGADEPRRASGLLALIATVAILGVTIAAIRTILATSTNRRFSSQGY